MVYERFLKPSKNSSLFLFGPRGCGKTTFIKTLFHPKDSLYLDLLDLELEKKLTLRPSTLKDIVLDLNPKIKNIIIDEVQKIPKLLDVVHLLIESTNKKFILTGSSARKLKKGKANLLAGRAFSYNLYPFSIFEVNNTINLDSALQWGMLPKVIQLKNIKDKIKFLNTYTHTYLKEEIISEQIIRNIVPFRNFLEISAQMNGKILNYSNLSRDVGVDDKTIKAYYDILEDTLIGFSLHAFNFSIRKQISSKPKFYFFDTGIKRALSNSLSIPLQNSTYSFGESFEHFIILECIKLANYFHEDYRFFYLRTKDNLEVDLIVERPGKPYLFIEIKSTDNVYKEDLKNLISIVKDFKNCEGICLSRDTVNKKIENIKVYNWKFGLEKYFL